MRGWRMAGPLVAGSVILNVWPNLYFAHIALSIANGMPAWRRTITALLSASLVPYVSFVVFRNTRAQANPKPSFGSGMSKIILCLPVILLSHVSNSGLVEPTRELRDGDAAASAGESNPPSPRVAAPAARRPRNPRRWVETP